jgi:hypothetical protein
MVRVWKEAVMALSRYTPCICQEGLRKTMKTLRLERRASPFEAGTHSVISSPDSMYNSESVEGPSVETAAADESCVAPSVYCISDHSE